MINIKVVVPIKEIDGLKDNPWASDKDLVVVNSELSSEDVILTIGERKYTFNGNELLKAIEAVRKAG